MFEQTEVKIDCPYCGEAFGTLIDCSGGSQSYYEDCYVCCAPILFVVSVNEQNQLEQIELRRDDQ